MGAVSEMSASNGLARPGTPAGAKAFVITPFTRLARTHAASTMADAMIAASLAGSLFFNLPAGDARAPVLRYLVITMLPFAVISPLIGPAIDRVKGGHRFMVIASTLARALVCFFMIGRIGASSKPGAAVDPLFFLLALCILVAQKAYSVARSALVPTVVGGDDALVEANSKLSLISGISGFVGIVPAAILLKGFGPQWSVGLAMLTYAAAGIIGLKIPRERVATASADATERHELRGVGIVMAGSAMGLIRAAVGFLTLLIAFDFRGGDRPTWQFGVVGGISVLSQLVGAAAAPRIRKFASEENLLTGVLGLLVLGGFVSLVVLGDVGGAAALGACVGFAAGAGKLAFDSILQRDAPDANRGRAFAKFETRFQVTWVIGALAPVAIHMSAHVGFAVVFVLALVAIGSYAIGRLAYAHRMGTSQNAATAAAVEIEDRFNEVSTEVKGRLASGSRTVFRRLRGRQVQAPGGAGEPADVALHGDDLDPDHTPPSAGGHMGQDLAATSPVAWQPPPEESEATYPWEPPPEPEPVPGAFLEDLDESVANPFPWSPDEPTRVESGAADPDRAEDATQVVGEPATRGHVPRPGSPSQVRQRRRRHRP
ncbi:MAG: putative major facilitator superfamily transporter [Acidimicrobiales bacterium]|nr:putative major facilitator superfamily transporter [Acidimicrobiales bacterium]